jgi:hypothetical protein
MKRKYEGVWFIFIVAVAALIVGCPNGEVPPVYEIGDTGPAGGIIFYIDDANAFTGTYLEAAPKGEEFTSTEWANKSGWLVGPDAQGTAIGDGQGNTDAIVEAYDSNPDVIDGYAAQRCDQLTVQIGGEPYSDWFLPSRDELSAMYENLWNISDPLGDFEDYQYWSSTETDDYNAVYVYFGDGSVGDFTKLEELYVRAVRSF